MGGLEKGGIGYKGGVRGYNGGQGSLIQPHRTR